MSSNFDDRDDGGADDGDSSDVWWRTVRGASTLQGVLTALRPIEQGCDAVHDVQAISMIANEAIAKVKESDVKLSEELQTEIGGAFKAAEERIGDQRIRGFMAAGGLDLDHYYRAVRDGETVTIRAAMELVMIADFELAGTPRRRLVGPGSDLVVVDPVAAPPVAREPEPEPDIDDYGPMEREQDAEIIPPEAPGSDDETAANPYFTILGHGGGRIYVYQREKKTITDRGEADWGELALTALAPLHWWETEFPAKEGFNRKLAVNWLQRMAFKLPTFDPDTLRGRGAWRDDGRFVFHFGHMLWVDGLLMDVAKIDSAYVYEQGRRLRLPHKDPLSSADGRKVYETFLEFHWTRPASAILLAGWCALAPIAGALRWRPHVWITGGAGSGKTTILNLVNWLMAGTALYAQGNSTEAGIRQALRIDSRPVLFDESEQNNDKEVLRIQNILSLIRQSSTESEAQTFKGTAGGSAMSFVIHSMFCLGSIQVGLKQQADIERVSVLTLRPKREGKDGLDAGTASENWKRISGSMAVLRADPELPAKLLHRALKLLPVTLQNVEVFAQAAAEKFGSQRDGDQYGTLLAGAWSLVSAQVASLDQARATIARYDWSDYLEGSETEESDKALAALKQRLIRVATQDVSVSELIHRAARVECDLRDISIKDAAAILKRYGIGIEWNALQQRADALLVADSNTELKRLMEPTPYSDLKGQLRRLPGAAKTEKKSRLGGNGVFATRIPMTLVLDGPEEYSAEPPMAENEDFDDEIDFEMRVA